MTTARAYDVTEQGNAERLYDALGGDIRYVPEAPNGRQWLLFRRRRWRWATEFDIDQRMVARVKAIQELESGVLDQTPQGEDRSPEELRKWGEELANWRKRSGKDSMIRGSLNRLKAYKGVSVSFERLDDDPHLVGALNGVLDLDGTRIRLHRDRRDLLVTKSLGVPYKPTAQCPEFLAFLERVQPDEAVREYLQKLAGYALTGLTGEQVFHLLVGSGANGKSQFFTVLETVLGDYHVAASTKAFMTSRFGGGGGPTPELAKLKGARLVTATEAQISQLLDAPLTKQLTGGDMISARFNRQDEIQFRLQGKIILATNELPWVNEAGDALWRRLRAVRWPVVIPEHERIPDYGKILVEEEGPGILNWMLAGYDKWRDEGLGMPEAIADATMEWLAREDLLSQWLEAECETGPDLLETSHDLYKSYNRHLDDNGHNEVSHKKFGAEMSQRFEAGRMSVGGKQTRIYRGVRLADAPGGEY